MKTLLRFALATAFALAATLAASAADMPSAPRKKILVFTKSSGFQHDAIRTENQPGRGYGFRVLHALAAKNNLELTLSKDGSPFSPEYLAQFDGFIFYTTGDLTQTNSDGRGDNMPPMSPAGKAALLQAIADGKGFVGIHSASDSFHSFGRNTHVPQRFDDDGDAADDYIKMLGGEFIRHGAQQKTRVIVADAKFPGVEAIPGDWAPQEEWYSLKNFARDMHVILVQETAGMTGVEYQRPPYPSTWIRPHGKGRVFYTSLGHREDIWDHPAFQAVLTGGINWTIGRFETDVTPNLAKAAPGAHVLPKYVAPASPAPKKAEPAKAEKK